MCTSVAKNAQGHPERLKMPSHSPVTPDGGISGENLDNVVFHFKVFCEAFPSTAACVREFQSKLVATVAAVNSTDTRVDESLNIRSVVLSYA